MSILGTIVQGVVSDVGMRSLFLVLLVLAILFLLAGAVLAVMALRNHRKVAQNGTSLQQLENEVG